MYFKKFDYKKRIVLTPHRSEAYPIEYNGNAQVMASLLSTIYLGTKFTVIPERDEMNTGMYIITVDAGAMTSYKWFWWIHFYRAIKNKERSVVLDYTLRHEAAKKSAPVDNYTAEIKSLVLGRRWGKLTTDGKLVEYDLSFRKMMGSTYTVAVGEGQGTYTHVGHGRPWDNENNCYKQDAGSYHFYIIKSNA